MSQDCGNCGASIRRQDARFCEYCGHELPRPEPVPGAPPSFEAQVDEMMRRLRAVREHPEWRELNALVPSMGGMGTGMGCGVVFMLVFAGFGLFWTVQASSMGAGPFALFGLIFVAVGLGGALKSGQSYKRFQSAPLEREPAMVVDERIKVSGGGKNSSASTKYFVSLELDDGRRREFRTTEPVASAVSRGDVGVAYVRDEYLLDFKRLRV